MEGWVDLVELIPPRPGVELAIFRSRVRCPITAPPGQVELKEHLAQEISLLLIHMKSIFVAYDGLLALISDLLWHSSALFTTDQLPGGFSQAFQKADTKQRQVLSPEELQQRTEAVDHRRHHEAQHFTKANTDGVGGCLAGIFLLVNFWITAFSSLLVTVCYLIRNWSHIAIHLVVVLVVFGATDFKKVWGPVAPTKLNSVLS